MPRLVYETIRSPSQQLDDDTRHSMERRFNHDFSRVRIHSDTLAAESSRALNANAYTVGNHMVFDSGQYAPGTTVGRRLLAHELAHVVQSAYTTFAEDNLPCKVAPDGSMFEAEAENAAIQLQEGIPTRPLSNATSPQIQRQQRGGGPGGPPSWLRGIRPARHVQGNIYEINVAGYGPTLVGPYSELSDYLRTQGLGEEAHHIVGREHLGDVRTGFTESNAPAVAMERGVHNAVSIRITSEQSVLGGRRGGRPVVSRTEIGELYRNVYTQDTNFPELANISDNILGIRTQRRAPALIAPPPLAGPPVPVSERGTEPVREAPRVPVRPPAVEPVPRPLVIPEARGQALGAGSLLALAAIGGVLNWIGNRVQSRLAREELARYERVINAERMSHPSQGVLLVFYFFQVEAPWYSVVQPGPRFNHVEWYAGATMEEARRRWLGTPAIRQGPGPGERIVTQTSWIPPLQLAGQE